MKLNDFFVRHPKAAIAFSGGTDSAYLLYAALQNKAEVQAYYVKSAFQPQFELDDAQRLARELHAPLRILTADVLSADAIAGNPPNRCYFCKRMIFETIQRAAACDGFPVLLDGTNASDDAADRPGMIAIRELSVLSPLRACGLKTVPTAWGAVRKKTSAGYGVVREKYEYEDVAQIARAQDMSLADVIAQIRKTETSV